MDEVWKDVLDWKEFYEISNLGRIKSKDRKFWHVDKKMKAGGCWKFRAAKMMKTPPNGDGYPQTRLCKDGKASTKRIHRLVWEAFNGSIPKDHHIDHINGDRANATLPNLQCLHFKEHKAKSMRAGQHARGSATKSSKLTETQVEEIRKKIKTKTYRELAAEYGVSKSTISYIITRRGWTNSDEHMRDLVEQARKLGYNEGHKDGRKALCINHSVHNESGYCKSCLKHAMETGAYL